MSAPITTSQVWQAIEKELFAVIGMVTAKNEARTVGIVYIVQDRKLYIGSESHAWKVRHIANNPHVSITIPIAKRIPVMPWIKIPAATITFSATAEIMASKEAPPHILQALYRGMEVEDDRIANTSIIVVTPERDFVTYGIGIPLMQMRDPNKARGRVPVS